MSYEFCQVGSKHQQYTPEAGSRNSSTTRRFFRGDNDPCLRYNPHRNPSVKRDLPQAYHNAAHLQFFNGIFSDELCGLWVSHGVSCKEGLTTPRLLSCAQSHEPRTCVLASDQRQNCFWLYISPYPPLAPIGSLTPSPSFSPSPDHNSNGINHHHERPIRGK